MHEITYQGYEKKAQKKVSPKERDDKENASDYYLLFALGIVIILVMHQLQGLFAQGEKNGDRLNELISLTKISKSSGTKLCFAAAQRLLRRRSCLECAKKGQLLMHFSTCLHLGPNGTSRL